MKFWRYHGLGNDYLVLRDTELKDPTVDQIVRICHRNFGVGSDGILLDTSFKSEFALRILNPDGSEAEKSGNGIRIFSRYLYDEGFVKNEPFKLKTLGGTVTCEVFDEFTHYGQLIKVEMGQVSFESQKIPVNTSNTEALGIPLEVAKSKFIINCATIGNPHCVIIVDEPTEELARKYGPLLENNPIFPKRINVQFVKIIDRNTIQIEIWERGAGYTLASGSSSSAAASVCKKLGLCDEQILVKMAGGELNIAINSAWEVTMKGGVTAICKGDVTNEVFDFNL